MTVGAARPATPSPAGRRARARPLERRRRDRRPPPGGPRGRARRLDAARLGRAADAAPPPRPIVERLAAPGLHLIAEIKRRSPSAGRDRRRPATTSPRGRAPTKPAEPRPSRCSSSRTGSAARSTTCARPAPRPPCRSSPRSSSSTRGSCPCCGPPARTPSCCSRPSTRRAASPASSRAALDLGLEPLVEAHDARELDARSRPMHGSSASTTATCGRSRRPGARRPAPRSSSPTTGSPSPSQACATRRPCGAGGRSVRRCARRRGADAHGRPGAPRASRPSWPPAREPDRPGQRRAPAVREDLRRHRGDGPRGRDRRRRGRHRAQPRPGHATRPRVGGGGARRGCSGRPRAAGRRPRIVGVFADAAPEVARDRRPRSAWTRSSSMATSRRTRSTPSRAGLKVAPPARRRAGDAAAAQPRRPTSSPGPRLPRGRSRTPSCSTPPTRRTRAAPVARRRTARRRGRRELPVILAGGLTRPTSRRALLDIPAVGVDVASGVERAARRRAGGPTKDPFRVALFVKRARAARVDRPTAPSARARSIPACSRPTPRAAGASSASSAAASCPRRSWPHSWSSSAPTTAIRQDPRFWAELRELLGAVRRPADGALPGRPARRGRRSRRRAWRGSAAGSARSPRSALYLKREDLAHTGAHKINNALGQTLLTRRLGKSRVIAETGAGQHGVATATACALLDLRASCTWARRTSAARRRTCCGCARSAPRSARSRRARPRSRTPSTRRCATGSPTSRPPTTSWARPWDRIRIPTLVRDLQRGSATRPRPARRRRGPAAGRRARVRRRRLERDRPAGAVHRRAGVRLAVVEAAGDGIETGRHAAAIAGGSPGILHGSRSLMLQDDDGQVTEAHSVSAGLDYPGDRAAARGARRGRPARGRRGDRPRGGRPRCARDPDRGHPAGARDRSRDRGAAGAARRRRGPSGRPLARPTTLVLLGLLGPRRQGPRRARAVRRRRALGDG